MSERPTGQELTEAIAEFLGGEILPRLDDQRLRFRTLVALNALGIMRRELTKLPREDDTEQRKLAARIRADDVPAGTLEDLAQLGFDRVAGAGFRHRCVLVHPNRPET